MALYTTLAMFVLAGLIHRLRGGMLFDLGIKLPGRDWLWAAPLLGLVAWLLTKSVALGVAYVLSMIIWSMLPHGRWWFGGAAPRATYLGRTASLFEWYCEKIVDTITRNTGVSDFILFSLKHYVAAIPFFFVLGPIAAIVYIPVSALVALIYRTVKLYAENKWWLCESLGGAVMWGTPVLLFLL